VGKGGQFRPLPSQEGKDCGSTCRRPSKGEEKTRGYLLEEVEKAIDYQTPANRRCWKKVIVISDPQKKGSGGKEFEEKFDDHNQNEKRYAIPHPGDSRKKKEGASSNAHRSDYTYGTCRRKK